MNIKIVHVNLSDNGGGGSLAALRLHTAMLNAGLDSTYLVFEKNIPDRDDIVKVEQSKFIRRYLSVFVKKLRTLAKLPFMGKLDRSRGSFDFCNGYGDILVHPELQDCDVVYIHCIQGGYLNYKALKKILLSGKKVVWFLHDNFAFTGGCLHPFECEKYQVKCRECPFWDGSAIFDYAKYEFDQKNKIISRTEKLIFIAPSFWMLGNVGRAAIAKNKKHYHIPNMVDPRVYKIIDKDVAQKLFYIDHGKKVIGFGAASVLTNPYKGWDYMKDALNILARDHKHNENIEVLIFGCSYQKEVAESLPFKTHFTGFLSDEYSMVMAYSAMDVYVMSSLAENFPQTILESLACNVPVVAFDVGGIPDMVNEDTGYLAKYKDANDLAKGINTILSRNEKMNVRQYVEKYFPDSILPRHFRMWEEEGIR